MPRFLSKEHLHSISCFVSTVSGSGHILFSLISCHIYPVCWQNTHFDTPPLPCAGTYMRQRTQGVCTNQSWWKHASWAKMPPYYSKLRQRSLSYGFICQKFASQETVSKFPHASGESHLWLTKTHTHAIPGTERPSPVTHPQHQVENCHSLSCQLCCHLPQVFQ